MYQAAWCFNARALYAPPLSLVSAQDRQAVTVEQTHALVETVRGSEGTRPPAGATQVLHSRATGAVPPGQIDGRINSSEFTVVSIMRIASGQCRRSCQYFLGQAWVMVAQPPIVCTCCGTRGRRAHTYCTHAYLSIHTSLAQDRTCCPRCLRCLLIHREGPHMACMGHMAAMTM